MTVAPAVALTIAGSDSSGGAGVVADTKTFAAHGVWATVAITAVTAQDTMGVHDIHLVDASTVVAQIRAVSADLGVGACKTGMLGSASIVAAVADALVAVGYPIVVDPVLVSTSGTALLSGDGPGVLRERLLPLATVVTPNLAEAALLTGLPVGTRDEIAAAARALVDLGCGAALVTGGHAPGDEVADCLVMGAAAPIWFCAPRLVGGGSHGTGCVLSAAITARLALGAELAPACEGAISFVRAAIGAGVKRGAGPAAAEPAS